MSLDINNDEFWKAHMVKQTQIEDWHNKLPKCGCGRVGRYETTTGLACNKYMRCDDAEFMAEQIKTLTAERDDLKVAAQAVVDRWDSPLWKNQQHTGNYINELRKALAKVK